MREADLIAGSGAYTDEGRARAAELRQAQKTAVDRNAATVRWLASQGYDVPGRVD